MRHCKQLLNKLPFDDYDRLIQLCDRLSVGVTYNIKERMKFIQNTYRLPVALVKKKYREALLLKSILMTNAVAISTSFWELPEMPLPTRQEAEAFLEYVITSRNNSPRPFLPQWEKEFRAHSRTVAEIASTIAAAKTAYLNPERAYLSGLLP